MNQLTTFARVAFAAVALSILTTPWSSAGADDCDDECQALRNAQDPLADVRAIMTDNTIAFGTSDDQTSYGFQVQPVYSIPTDAGFNFIARGIIPIVGAQEGAGLPKLGPESVGGSAKSWSVRASRPSPIYRPAKPPPA